MEERRSLEVALGGTIALANLIKKMLLCEGNCNAMGRIKCRFKEVEEARKVRFRMQSMDKWRDLEPRLPQNVKIHSGSEGKRKGVGG